ncbi:RNase adapter RapZ [Lonepinella sp. MS14437]|uniref:RNase adapter RapZ n=1 Tax=unclassified Lonepinella TaxID=2642006 RepID=UPI0036DA9625
MELIIVSGRSGAGKSVALRALEDIGYYCVDNLPIELLPQLAQILSKNQQLAAVSVDIRNLPDSAESLEQMINLLSEQHQVKIIFLDANQDVLIRRYSDSRRPHPLSSVKDISLEVAINAERDYLEPLYQQANIIIDTTELSTHELAENLRNFLRGQNNKELKIVVESFGFKYGIPLDADYVFDVRFLPNPHWDPALRAMTGLDQPVIDFLKRHTEVHNFVYQTRHFIETWLPMLEKNNRSYLTIAVGCTGGKHRSVYIAEQIGNYFKKKDKNVSVVHHSLKHNLK